MTNVLFLRLGFAVCTFLLGACAQAPGRTEALNEAPIHLRSTEKEDLLAYKRAVYKHFKEHHPQEIARLQEEIRVKTRILLFKAQLNYHLPMVSLIGVFFVDLGHEFSAQTKFTPEGYIIEVDEMFFLIDTELFLRRSIAHEIAHIVAYEVERCLSHECESFKNTMIHLSGEASDHFSIPASFLPTSIRKKGDTTDF
jgi:hypothetical protein